MKLVQRTVALASLPVLFFGLSGPGCGPNCTENQITLSKEAGHFNPDYKWDWVCVDIPPPPPPPPPPLVPPAGVIGDHPANVKGPKDPDSAIKMVITLGTCLYGYNSETLNEKLDYLYFARSRDSLIQAVNDRTTCFKDKTNACDATAECVGIADLFVNPQYVPTEPTPECNGGTRHKVFPPTETQTPLALARWFNCEGMGLECNEKEAYSLCDLPRTRCNPTIKTDVCAFDVPADCVRFSFNHPYGWVFEHPECSEFGLMCNGIDTASLFTDCIGTGPECAYDYEYVHDDNVFDYRLAPLACESETMLRSCVGTRENVIDCAQLGIGFKCLPGPVPHCGLDTECTAETPITCDGDSIVVCNAGRIHKVDCKTLGFTSCDATRGICGPNIYEQGGILK